MKKSFIAAAAFAVTAVSSIALAPTTAEAIPAFARQTGSACLSCHFQTFPAVTAMGRSFKLGGFTDMGEQALIEADEMSIPATLNATVVLRPQFSSVKVTGLPETKTAAMPADQVVLLAGRVGSNTGAFVELGGGTFGNFQLMNSFDLGAAKAGVNFFNTGFGETAGIELSNVFGQHGGNLNGKSISAANNIKSFGGNTGGVALWAGNELGMASLSLITDGAALTGAVGNGWKLAPSLRVFLTPEVGGWGLGIGGGVTSGTTGNAQTVAAVALPAGTKLEMKKTFVDFQAEGAIGDTSLGIYADWAQAKAGTGATVNLFNTAGAGNLSGHSLRANIKPLHNVLFGVGFGNMKLSDAALGSKTDSLLFAATYEVYQNFEVTLSYKSDKSKPNNGAAATTTTTTLLDIEALM